MRNGIRVLYWKLLERGRLFLSALRTHPPGRRLISHVQARLCRIVDLDGVRIRLSPSMGNLAVSYILSGNYELPERRMLNHALTRQDRVMELGTGIGYLSSYCANRIGSDRVFTFEANPSLRPLIESTYALNGVSPHLEVCMLGETSGTAEFFVTKSFWGSSTLHSRHTIKKIQVQVRSFNEALRQICPSFLIIDIEGGELDLMHHGSFEGVEKLCIELHPYVIGADNVRWVVDRILAQGFQQVDAVSDDEHKLFVRKT